MDQQNLQFTEFNNGQKMPRIQLGTANTETVQPAIVEAIKIGYRAIDTAAMYLNEEKIGNAVQQCIKEGIVERKDLFITSKLRSEDKKNVRGAVLESLKKLQIEYLDLYLIHWPGGYFDENKEYHNVPLHEVWQNMEKLVEEGLVKSIGVSNFQVPLLADLMSYAKIKPVLNQVEVHPYFQQTELQYTCQLFGIKIACFSPLVRGGKREKDGKIINIFEDEIVLEISKKYEKSPSQIILNWHLQNPLLNPVPRSENPGRLKDNLDASQFNLEKEDIEKINNLDCNIRMCLSKAKFGLDYFS